MTDYPTTLEGPPLLKALANMSTHHAAREAFVEAESLEKVR